MHTVKKNILVGLSHYILSLSTQYENQVFYRIVSLLASPDMSTTMSAISSERAVIKEHLHPILDFRKSYLLTSRLTNVGIRDTCVEKNHIFSCKK